KNIPLYSTEAETIRMELFGNISNQVSPGLNYHLTNLLEAFDEEFSNQGGRIGSYEHRFERFEFAKAVSKSILDTVKDKNGTFNKIETCQEYRCYSMPINMKIRTVSNLGNDNILASDLPFEPN
ncbi:MAG: hypothetical protein AAFO07_17495, partial [Bacteroidota bacterium]